MKTVLLKLSGPLQSWGTTSHFETRQTDRYPSKSAIIGLIAASLGYRRDEDLKIEPLNELDFGVRLDQIGGSLRDYHTATKYKKNGAVERTYVTNRYYLEDAVFVVAISHKDEAFMNTIESGLKHPYFQPYMGRRSLPVPADFIIDVNTKGVIESLEELPWQASNWYKRKHTNRLVAYVDADLVEVGVEGLRRDRVTSFSQSSREFGFRGEKRITINAVSNLIPNKTNHDEHDAISIVGGEG